MFKPRDPRELALDLLPRTICAVQVTAVLADNYGIHSWGWNSVGSGWGEHAEAAAIRRANKKRLRGSTIYVASVRNRNQKVINSKPCPDCQRLIDKWGLKTIYRNMSGEWIDE